jgi:hypothetical protein
MCHLTVTDGNDCFLATFCMNHMPSRGSTPPTLLDNGKLLNALDNRWILQTFGSEMQQCLLADKSSYRIAWSTTTHEVEQDSSDSDDGMFAMDDVY